MILSLFAMSFFALCLIAALIDIETLTIPNWLNGWLAFLFIPAVIVAAPGWETIGWHVMVGAIAFIISVALFFLGVYGGGDAKFIPAALLWIGPAGVAPFLVVTALAGGVPAGRSMLTSTQSDPGQPSIPPSKPRSGRRSSNHAPSARRAT